MSDITAAFFNGSGRLRSGWRAVVFILLFVFSSVSVNALLLAAGGAALSVFPLSLIVNAASSLVLALILGSLCGKYLEGLPLASIGIPFTRTGLRNLVHGSILGAATLSLAVLIAFAGRGTDHSLTTASTLDLADSIFTSFLIFGVAAAFEEALFRGYVLQTLARSGFAWTAIALTAIFFGMIHIANPGATLLSTTNTILAGVWFGLAYLRTRDLWFVWGLHFMWNWMQGSIFGVEVSGLTALTPYPLLHEIDHGPEWLTGAAYGLEGGVACTLAIIVSILYIILVKPRKALTAEADHARTSADLDLE